MNYPIGILLIALTLGSCRNETTSAEAAARTPEEQLAQLYCTDNLNTQHYRINTGKDTLLHGKGGTVLRIYKNTFVDGAGKPITGSVEIALKEALDPAAIVLANLTTTSNGRPLQTGGMIWLGATSNNQEVRIANNKAIGVIIPQKALLENMQVYKGAETADGINWVAPEPTLNKEVAGLQQQQQGGQQRPKGQPQGATVSEIDAIFEFVDGDTTGTAPLSAEEQRMVDRKQAALPIADSRFVSEIAEKGQNFFQEDANTSYIFELKQLGWANIDRMYDDPRTRPVNLLTTIGNAAQFKQIYITMVISGMYLPGYQMKDGSFSFAHDDSERQQFPIGEKAIVFATSYKDGSPYFDLAAVTIQSSQKVTLDLKKTTEDQLKQTLKNKL